MWIIDPPSSTTRRASAAYSSGVYGMAGHWSRFATAPLIELVMTTGWSKRLMPAAPRVGVPLGRCPRARRGAGLAGKEGGTGADAPSTNRVHSFAAYSRSNRSIDCRDARSYRHHPMPLARAVHVFRRGHLQALDHHGARLTGVDDVVDHRV